MDKGQIVAEGSPRGADRAATRRARCSRSASRRAPGERVADRRRRPTRRGAARPRADLHATTATRRGRRGTSLAAADSRSSAAARSRTSSSASPAARSSTEDGKPPPAAPRVRALARAVQAVLARLRSGRAPQPAALPRRARRRTRHDRRHSENAPAACRTSTSSRRACSRPPRCIPHDRVELARLGAIKWTRTYYAMTATPLTERDVLFGHQLFVITRVFTASAVLPPGRGGLRGGGTPGGAPRDPGGGARRHRVLVPDGRVRRHAWSDDELSADLPLPDRADVPLLGHVLPGRPDCRWRSSWRRT